MLDVLGRYTQDTKLFGGNALLIQAYMQDIVIPPILYTEDSRDFVETQFHTDGNSFKVKYKFISGIE